MAKGKKSKAPLTEEEKAALALQKAQDAAALKERQKTLATQFLKVQPQLCWVELVACFRFLSCGHITSYVRSL